MAEFHRRHGRAVQKLTLSMYGFDEIDVSSQSGSSGVQMDSILKAHTNTTTGGQRPEREPPLDDCRFQPPTRSHRLADPRP